MIRAELSFRHLLLFLAILLLGWLCYQARGTFVIFGAAPVLAVTVYPLVKRVQRYGVPHGAAVAIVIVAMVLVPVIVIALLTPVVAAQVHTIVTSGPQIEAHIDQWLRAIGVDVHTSDIVNLFNLEAKLEAMVTSGVGTGVTVVVDAVAIIAIIGYLLSDGSRVLAALRRFVPAAYQPDVAPLLQQLEQVVGGYMRGQVITSAVFGAFAFLLCLAIGVPNPLLMGVIAAIGDVIPLFGVQAATVSTMLLASVSSAWQPLAVLIGYVVYGQLAAHVIEPQVYGRHVNLDPLLVLSATIIGGALDGVVGILLGIPIVASIKVVANYLLREERHRSEQQRPHSRTSGREVMGTVNARATASEARPALRPSVETAADGADLDAQAVEYLGA